MAGWLSDIFDSLFFFEGGGGSIVQRQISLLFYKLGFLGLRLWDSGLGFLSLGNLLFISLVRLCLADVAVAGVVLVVARVWFRRWDGGSAYGGHADDEGSDGGEDVCFGG